MLDWLLGLQPNELASVLAAFASVVAAIIAAVSLAVHASSARRQARLTLMERRLQIYSSFIGGVNVVESEHTHIAPKPSIEDIQSTIYDAKRSMLMSSLVFGPDIELIMINLLNELHFAIDPSARGRLGSPSTDPRYIDHEFTQKIFNLYFKNDRLLGYGALLSITNNTHNLIRNIKTPPKKQ